MFGRSVASEPVSDEAPSPGSDGGKGPTRKGGLRAFSMLGRGKSDASARSDNEGNCASARAAPPVAPLCASHAARAPSSAPTALVRADFDDGPARAARVSSSSDAGEAAPRKGGLRAFSSRLRGKAEVRAARGRRACAHERSVGDASSDPPLCRSFQAPPATVLAVVAPSAPAPLTVAARAINVCVCYARFTLPTVSSNLVLRSHAIYSPNPGAWSTPART